MAKILFIMSDVNLSLDVLVPGLRGPMPDLQGDVSRRFPLLEQVMAKSCKVEVSGYDLASTLFRCFGIEQGSKRDLPIAAFCYLADGGWVDDEFRFLVSPVYYKPDNDRLLVFDSTDLGVDFYEAEMLAEKFNQHFLSDGWQLEVLDAERWYLKLNQVPAIKTRSLSDVNARNVDAFLPFGDDEKVWISMLNEVQMLFHQSEVNLEREKNGRLPINGVWLYGGGKKLVLPASSYNHIFAEDVLTQGLARVASIQIDPVPDDLHSLFNRRGKQLVVNKTLQASMLSGDVEGWLGRLELFQTWLEPLVEGLKVKKIDQLNLYSCNGQVWQLQCKAMRKFWKRSKPFCHELDENSYE